MRSNPTSVARIEAGAAGFDHAQRRVVGRERTAREHQDRQPEPALQARTPRRSCSRNLRSWCAHDQHREHEGHAKSAHDQEERRLDGRDQEKVCAAEQRRHHPTMTVDSIRNTDTMQTVARMAPNMRHERRIVNAQRLSDRGEGREAITPERGQRDHEQGHRPEHGNGHEYQRRGRQAVDERRPQPDQQQRKSEGECGREQPHGPARQRGGELGTEARAQTFRQRIQAQRHHAEQRHTEQETTP